jgi:transcriptional regulator with XRE-family HTH domain
MSIKILREKNSYSQQKLADLSNLSLRTIQRIESQNSGSDDSLSSIASVFDMSLDELKIFLQEDEVIEQKQQIGLFTLDKKLLRFLVIIIALVIINLLTSPDFIWFVFPLFGWGVPFFYNRYKRISQ